MVCRCAVFFVLVCTWTAGEVRGIESTEADDEPVNPTWADTQDRPWVSKCCNFTYGYSFESKSKCVKTSDEFLPRFYDLPEYSDVAKNMEVKERYEYFIGDPCFEGKYVLNVTEYPDEPYFIFSNGTVKYLDQLYTYMDFCLETVNGSVEVFLCFDKRDDELDITFRLYAIPLLISVPFLFLTAVIYLSIESIRDNRGKSLACHVLCLCFGYLILALVQLKTDNMEQDFCTAAGFIIQYCFVAAFFWLSVICFDTWDFIRKECPFVYKRRNSKSKSKKFCWYSLYAWYGPALLSIVSLIMDFEPAIPRSYIKPNFGLKSCWLYADDAAFSYYYGPVAILILVDVIFGVLSVFKIYRKQKKSEKKMRTNGSIDETREKCSIIRRYKNTLQESFFFFMIMGVNWAADIISWATARPQLIWILTDLFNAFQGVMIFYLFVIKPDQVRFEVKKNMWKFWVKIRDCKCWRLDTKKNLKSYNGAESSADERFL